MMMSMNEKKILFAFGCPKRELTVERLRHAAALAVDPAAKKAFYSLAVKLYEDIMRSQKKTGRTTKCLLSISTEITSKTK